MHVPCMHAPDLVVLNIVAMVKIRSDAFAVLNYFLLLAVSSLLSQI
jgi:hypothetical protein